MAFKLKGLLKLVAPTVGTAIGGPMGGMAAKAVAQVLDCPPEPEAIEEALENAPPEKLEQVKQVDKDFALKMKQLDIDLYAREVDDRKDARKAFARDLTPKMFCILALVLYGVYVMTVTIMPHDQNDETIISLVLGQLSGILGTCAAFFYGGKGRGG